MFQFDKKGLFSFLLLLFCCQSLFGQQQNIALEIKWKEARAINFEDENYLIPNFEDAELSSRLPVYYFTQKLKSKNYSISLGSFQTTSASNEDLNYFKKIGKEISSTLEVEFQVTDNAREYFAVVQLFPFIKENGVVKRISSINFNLTAAPAPQFTEKDFATTSVLGAGTGTWYKISIKNDGFYKIDKAFLESIGINTAGLNPNHINIYGNGDGRLPEINNIPRTDDLAKNAIYVTGDADNSFDAGDQIIFYGWGPHKWSQANATTFNRDQNIYSDISCYFININSNETPLRIQDLPNSDDPVTHVVTDYNFYDVYEQDYVSLVKGGQRWYGDLFDTELERTFNFSVPNIVASTPAVFKIAIASNAPSSSGTSHRYYLNNALLLTDVLPAVSADFARDENTFSWSTPAASMALKMSITRTNPNTLTYLDRILLNARRNLVFYGSHFRFRNLTSTGIGNVSDFTVSSFPSNGFVWEVSDRQMPRKVLGVQSGSTFTFRQHTDTLREFAVSNGVTFQIPDFVGAVESQNIHALPLADLVIVTPTEFISQANRLADLHREEGLVVHVLRLDQIYNEFSSGMVDATAIRMMAKMFYDRGTVAGVSFKNLLLFGDGTYDPKNRVANNNYFVPTYQMIYSENHIDAMVTDDYFGMLSDSDGIMSTDMQDIGVGRLLISDNTQAKQQVDKIEHYMKNGSDLYTGTTNNCCDGSNSNSTFGDWRLNYVQITDDEENGYFIVQDAEPQYDTVSMYNYEMNCDKLYTDAYTQETTAGGQRYPSVFEGITNRVNRGALLVNYIGHGGEVGLSEERIVTIPQILSWTNINNLNVFVSATCEFTKYDDPSRVSAGEWVSLNPTGGAIALMTTSRAVYFGVNTITGRRFFENVFKRDSDNLPKQFGEIMRLTKNGSGSSDNKRSFTLIGDPALRIAHPRMKVVTDSINGLSPQIEMDTLNALSFVTIKGHVEDHTGNVLSGFNGTLAPSVFDKVKMQQTLGQDSDSPILPFDIQKNIVYKGKATVENGYFSFSFIVPKDIDLSYGHGKISYYADNGTFDAAGYDTLFTIGGINPNGVNDVVGPTIELYLNDDKFVNQGITNETPILIADLFDENGINTVGNGIGHDITLIVDNNTAQQKVLNEYYAAAMDSYQSGKITYQMSELTAGKHTLTFKVWDVNNNSSEKTIDFEVKAKEKLELAHVLNYPNPFTTATKFFFEHNQVCSQLETQVQIMTISGRLVKTINRMVNTQGFRSEGIDWDGKDDFGDQLAKGVYIYRISAKMPNGEIAEKIEKLVLLK
ncbi:MAG: type IX secretion system sortase PorU [Bacteroidota bacterium]